MSTVHLDPGDQGLLWLNGIGFRPTYEVRCEIYYVNFELPGTVAECSEDIEWAEKWTPEWEPIDWPTPVDVSAPPAFSLAMPKSPPQTEKPTPYDPWGPPVVLCCSTTGTTKNPPVEVGEVPLPAGLWLMIAVIAALAWRWK